MYSVLDQAHGPVDFRRWELAALGLLIALSLTLGWLNVDHKRQKAYAGFQELAPRISAALERFAADHQGRLPGRVLVGQRPKGLDDSYLRWNPRWGVAYSVFNNRSGGDCVCLEFMYPPQRHNYRRLCRNPDYRRLYGKGQPIPGESNRIWVVRESAQTLPGLPALPRKKKRPADQDS